MVDDSSENLSSIPRCFVSQENWIRLCAQVAAVAPPEPGMEQDEATAYYSIRPVLMAPYLAEMVIGQELLVGELEDKLHRLIPNVLAQRYASEPICEIWSPVGKLIAERQLWVAVIRAQHGLGVDIPADAIVAYEAVVEQVDLASIDARELGSKHDLNAHIEEFNALSGGCEYIHLGMTSRDVTDNVEQMQVRLSLLIIRNRMVAALARLATLAAQHETTVIAGRTHNMPAQAITLGKRIANSGQETLIAYQRIEELLARYPLRGLIGPVGTAQDQLDLLGGDEAKLAQLQTAVAEHLGFEQVLTSVGQVYPRSLDLDVVSALTQAVAGPSSFATTMRLMAGQELAIEGFKPGQVGSSAMPHKMNSRSCERINGFATVLAGHLTMASGLSGGQWNEGDVSCSVVRRVCLPDSFFACEGAYQTFLHVLDELGFYEAVISKELVRYLPFLATTKVLMAAVLKGQGREEAHKVIKEHATAVVLAMREEGAEANDLFDRLAADSRLDLSRDELQELLSEPLSFTGCAQAQTREFIRQVEEIVAEHPEAAVYQPESMR